jgi:hypothetical protein
MPPRTRRSGATAPMPQVINENRGPMINNSHTGALGLRQEQNTLTPGVSAADTSITRRSLVY